MLEDAVLKARAGTDIAIRELEADGHAVQDVRLTKCDWSSGCNFVVVITAKREAQA